MKKIVLTGDRPTGNLHLGHYAGSLTNRIELQHIHKQYVMIADTQALTDNFDNPQKIIDNIYNVASDYIAVGLDPNLTTIFIQSQVSALFEITSYYLNLVTVSRLERNPTVKLEIKQKNYEESIPAGFFCYPVSQAADITAVGADLVPVGEDQIPMIEQTNEIVRKFNRIYNTDILKEAEALLSQSPRLPGIDGKSKASKSLNNAIFLNDSAIDIKNKIFSMYTDPNHLKISDPGKIEGNIVFAYLDAFYHNKDEVESLKSHYQKGGLGDVTIKNILNDYLQKMLEPIREKRSNIDKNYLRDILHDGSKNAQSLALTNLERIRETIGIKYFR